MIRAVIFDVDGTLVDSVGFHAEAWHRAFRHFGHDIDTGAIRSQIGKGGDQLMPVFLPEAEVKEHGEVIETYRKHLFERDYMGKVRGFPEVRALFERLRADGTRIALASSAKGDELSAYKRAADIEGLTDIETSSDDADKSKPHPDIFQAALDKLGCPPEEAVVIGDSPYDAEAAGKAGVTAVGVLCGGFPEADLKRAGMIEIFRDPADLLRRYEHSIVGQRRS